MTKHTRTPRTPAGPPRKKGSRSRVGQAMALLAERDRAELQPLQSRIRAVARDTVEAEAAATERRRLEMERWSVGTVRNRLLTLGMSPDDIQGLEDRARAVTSEERIEIVLERAAKVREQTCEHDLAVKLHDALAAALVALDAMARIDHVGLTAAHVGIEDECIGLIAHIRTMARRIDVASPTDPQDVAIEKAQAVRGAARGDLKGFSKIEKTQIMAMQREEEAEGIVNRLTYEELRVALDGHSAAALRSKKWRKSTPKRHAPRSDK